MADCLVCKKPIPSEANCYEIRHGYVSHYEDNDQKKEIFVEFFPQSDLGYVHEKCLNFSAPE